MPALILSAPFTALLMAQQFRDLYYSFIMELTTKSIKTHNHLINYKKNFKEEEGHIT